jgi:nucleoside-diphosphate-sugar epimerase
MTRYGKSGGNAVVLRPGCVYGPGSALWIGRIGRWLESGRIGDLGANGDGWSNLVHVDDVCKAIANSLSLELPAGTVSCFNLAAPDSPRWNDYFGDLANAIGATPLRRPGIRRVRLDARLFGPPLKILELAARRLKLSTSPIPEAIPPALLRFFAQQIHLDTRKAQQELQMNWQSYSSSRPQFAEWFRATGK